MRCRVRQERVAKNAGESTSRCPRRCAGLYKAAQGTAVRAGMSWFLRCILPRWSSVCSMVRSFASLLCAKCTVSVSKSKVQPHHVMLCPSCAFFQLMGALRHVSRAMSRHAASGKSCAGKAKAGHPRRATHGASRLCKRRVKSPPTLAHQ